MKRDYYKDADFYGDIDVRLQDYHNHSREFGHVDRIPTAYSDFRKVGEVTANGSEVVERGSCTWDITIETFPIGDEV